MRVIFLNVAPQTCNQFHYPAEEWLQMAHSVTHSAVLTPRVEEGASAVVVVMFSSQTCGRDPDQQAAGLLTSTGIRSNTITSQDLYFLLAVIIIIRVVVATGKPAVHQINRFKYILSASATYIYDVDGANKCGMKMPRLVICDINH